jgi:predicted GIY-YIG superfamily endonuclease
MSCVKTPFTSNRFFFFSPQINVFFVSSPIVLTIGVLREMLPKEYIYTLRLEHGCWYVGRSSSVNLRVTDHWAGNGAAWTRLHPIIEVWTVCSMASPLSEERVTEELMEFS